MVAEPQVAEPQGALSRSTPLSRKRPLSRSRMLRPSTRPEENNTFLISATWAI